MLALENRERYPGMVLRGDELPGSCLSRSRRWRTRDHAAAWERPRFCLAETGGEHVLL